MYPEKQDLHRLLCAAIFEVCIGLHTTLRRCAAKVYEHGVLDYAAAKSVRHQQELRPSATTGLLAITTARLIYRFGVGTCWESVSLNHVHVATKRRDFRILGKK